jgi:hypothetical protein
VNAILACWVMLFPAFAYAEVTANDPLPIKLLTCGGNIIKGIGSPLEGDAEMSTGFHVWAQQRWRHGGLRNAGGRS